MRDEGLRSGPFNKALSFVADESIVPIVVVAVATVSVAASPSAEAFQSDGFARNIWSTVSFLDQSSRLAMKQSRSKRLREFARSEAVEQTTAANAFAAWIDSTEGGNERPATSRGTSSTRSMMASPFRAAASLSSGVADAIDGMQTGRSVAVDSEGDKQPTSLKAITVPSFSANLDQLTALSGRAFDNFYRESQIDALLQLSTLYASYIQNGGDPGLRALAVRELPKVNGRLALIKSIP